MTSTVIVPHRSIIITLLAVAKKYKKGYCYPSQETIMALHRRFSGHKMSRRTLCRHLKTLELQGWIKRTRRHTHHPMHGYIFKSTLYVIRRKAYKWLGLAVKNVGAFVGKSRVTHMSHNVSSQEEIIGETGPSARSSPKNSDVALASLARLKEIASD